MHTNCASFSLINLSKILKGKIIFGIFGATILAVVSLFTFSSVYFQSFAKDQNEPATAEIIGSEDTILFSLEYKKSYCDLLQLSQDFLDDMN